MNPTSSVRESLGNDIVRRVEGLLLEAETAGKPLEIEPFRPQLFELFVTANAAGYIDQDAALDLTAEGLCRQLSTAWGLAAATRESSRIETKLRPTDLGRMRLLWSLMRMWMEWDYAWSRWTEFHEEPQGDT